MSRARLMIAAGVSLLASCALLAESPRSPAGPSGVVGGGLVASPSGAPIRVALVGGFEDCGGGGAGDVAPEIRTFLDGVARALAVPRARDAADITLTQIEPYLIRPEGGALLAIYAGHATRTSTVGRTVTSLCLRPQPVPAQALIDKARVGPVVIVLGACESAYVDVSQSAAVSVISASPNLVRVDPPDFLRLVTEALSRDDLDRNCDGLVTDRELFEYVTDAVKRSDPMGQNRPIPKLRRQADYELPILRRWPPRAGCADPSALADMFERAGELGADLEKQIAFAKRRGPLDFAAAHGDHLLLTFAGADAPPIRQAIRENVARAAKDRLILLPELTSEQGRRLAELNIAGDVYELRATLVRRRGDIADPAKWRNAGIILELLHASDRRILDVVDLAGVADLPAVVPKMLPTRQFAIARHNLGRSDAIVVRVVGQVHRDLTIPDHVLDPATREAVPCREEEGQCFSFREKKPIVERP